MITKLSTVVGFGAGYVLGSRAGRERYEQIRRTFDNLRGTPQVQKATDTVVAAAADLADKASGTISDTIDSVTSKTVDLSDRQRSGSVR